MTTEWLQKVVTLTKILIMPRLFATAPRPLSFALALGIKTLTIIFMWITIAIIIHITQQIEV